MRRDNRSKTRNSKFEIRNCLRAFALYEVLLGVAIFAVGVLALGRAVENCLNASMLNAEEEAVRQMESMAHHPTPQSYSTRDHAGGRDPRDDVAGDFSLCPVEPRSAACLSRCKRGGRAI